jgi:hypothetical protein
MLRFLLVQLHMDSLLGQTSIKGLKRQLSSLPADLDETYNQAMSRIRAQSRSEMDLAQRVLCWVTFAHRPLEMRALRQAVSIEVGDTEVDWDAITLDSILVSVCAGLVVVDAKAYVVRLVREYSSSCASQSVHICTRRNHTRLSGENATLPELTSDNCLDMHYPTILSSVAKASRRGPCETPSKRDEPSPPLRFT